MAVTEELKDARGVQIEAGDTVIYGFGVGRSVAMAEGVVIGEDESAHRFHHADNRVIDISGVHRYIDVCSCGADYPHPLPVSLTASGRVRIRVVRRSYGGGEKPVVDIAPDRIVVLKTLEYRVPGSYGNSDVGIFLPVSPLPTQDEENYGRLATTLERYLDDIERLSTGGPMDNLERQVRNYDTGDTVDGSPERRAYWLERYREWSVTARKDLEAVCARLSKEMPL